MHEAERINPRPRLVVQEERSQTTMIALLCQFEERDKRMLHWIQSMMRAILLL